MSLMNLQGVPGEDECCISWHPDRTQTDTSNRLIGKNLMKGPYRVWAGVKEPARADEAAQRNGSCL
jgi:hypothetical protein